MTSEREKKVFWSRERGEAFGASAMAPATYTAALMAGFSHDLAIGLHFELCTRPRSSALKMHARLDCPRDEPGNCHISVIRRSQSRRTPLSARENDPFHGERPFLRKGFRSRAE